MSDEMELKPCPFCGSTEIYCEDEGFLTCDNCGVTMPKMLWNTRPIEDALRSQLASCDALIEGLIAMGEKLAFLACIDTQDDMDAYFGWKNLAKVWQNRAAQ